MTTDQQKRDADEAEAYARANPWSNWATPQDYYLAGLRAERSRMEAKLALAVEALNSVEAKSHSWVIKDGTAHIEMPIHESYRKLARSALERIRGDL